MRLPSGLTQSVNQLLHAAYALPQPLREAIASAVYRRPCLWAVASPNPANATHPYQREEVEVAATKSGIKVIAAERLSLCRSPLHGPYTSLTARTNSPILIQKNSVRSEERRVGKECRSRW